MDTPNSPGEIPPQGRPDRVQMPVGRSGGDGETPLVERSRLAVASFVLSITGVLLVFADIFAHAARVVPIGNMPPWFTVLDVSSVCALLLSVLLGVLAFFEIALRPGRVIGEGLALAGIVIPVVVGLFFAWAAARLPVRCYAFKDTCSTNLSGIGKAMLVYANDYDDELPRAGGRNSTWTGITPDWKGVDRFAAYGLRPDGSGGSVGMSASFYLLVKYTEVTPKSFICKGDKGTTVWNPSDEPLPRRGFELIDAWDFGPQPQKHVSFAYHQVYGPYKLTTQGEPGFAVVADRNPWQDSPAHKAGDFSRFVPYIKPWNGTSEQAKYGNTSSHQGDGESVLFLDSHVNFEKYSCCGVDDDNVYTYWDGDDKVRGLPPTIGSQPADSRDSLLVNDGKGTSSR